MLHAASKQALPVRIPSAGVDAILVPGFYFNNFVPELGQMYTTNTTKSFFCCCPIVLFARLLIWRGSYGETCYWYEALLPWNNRFLQ
jgi:hypothetical protein